MAQITLNSTGVASDGALVLQSNGTTSAVTISTAQNVGIGIAPSFPLDVQSTGVGSSIASRIYRSDGTIALLRIGNSTSGSGATAPAFGSDTTAAVFYTNNSEKMRIDSSGNVGIGTTSPSSYSFDTGVDLVVGDGNSSTITVVSSATGTGYLAFADGTSGIDRYSGLVEYNHTSNYLAFRTASIERMRIDSAGNLQVQAGAVMPYAPAHDTSIGSAATLTNAIIQKQIIVTSGTTYTVTMPLGTTLETLATWATTGIAYDFYVINTASGTITLDATEVGVTSVGTMTIATGVSAQFRIRRTAANTFVVYRLG